jgi:hypothetical protein
MDLHGREQFSPVASSRIILSVTGAMAGGPVEMTAAEEDVKENSLPVETSEDLQTPSSEAKNKNRSFSYISCWRVATFAHKNGLSFVLFHNINV